MRDFPRAQRPQLAAAAVAVVLLALAAAVYGIGGLALTMGISVPLNEELAAAGPPRP